MTLPSSFPRYLWAALLVCWSIVTPAALVCAAEEAKVAEDRLFESAKYLASDELEGRGVGTKGLDLAADYVARQFAEAGLKTRLFDGGPFEKFKMLTGAALGSTNNLALVGPPTADSPQGQRIELKIGEDFNPLAIGGSGKFDLPLVFVGYGISGKQENYDEYAGIDVKDKAVVILRHEPQQSNPHSVFGGNHSQHAAFTRKVSNAYEHGAAAVLLCSDDFDIQKSIAQMRKRTQAAVDQLVEENAKFKALEKPNQADWQRHQDEIENLADQIKTFTAQTRAAGDPLLSFEGAGPDGSGRNFPVVYCRRSILDKIVRSTLGTDLADIEGRIDKGPTPASHSLDGWRAVGEISVQQQEAEVKNVVAVLEGEGPLADETIVIGAHYDHLGWGGGKSLAPGVHEIHNGADDNASGTAVLVEIARQLAARPQRLPRRIVFIAFTGEERGLIGSARYVREPLVPLDKTIAMLNMDMVGRLKDNKLIIYGTGTAPQFDPLVDRFGKEMGFEISKQPGGFGPSDQSSFYAKRIPVLHFFTGSHADYHRPSDDFDKLNVEGMRRVGESVAQVAAELATSPERPEYKEVKGSSTNSGGDRPYFGSIPDFSQDQPGYALTGVAKGGPAERAGIRAGDIIIRFGESKIGNLEDFDSALRKFKAGDKVPLIIKRGAQELKIEVTLDPPR